MVGWREGGREIQKSWWEGEKTWEDMSETWQRDGWLRGVRGEEEEGEVAVGSDKKRGMWGQSRLS